ARHDTTRVRPARPRLPEEYLRSNNWCEPFSKSVLQFQQSPQQLVRKFCAAPRAWLKPPRLVAVVWCHRQTPKPPRWLSRPKLAIPIASVSSASLAILIVRYQEQKGKERLKKHE